MQPTPAHMQSFKTVQSVLLWHSSKATCYKRRLTFGLKLMIILFFQELLGRCNREVVCACQACDAGSKAKTVVASGAAVLTFTHQRWRAVSRHSNVPSVSITSQSSGPSSTHPVVCAALFVLRQPQLLVVPSLPSKLLLDLRWQACPQPHSCCCVQLLQ